LFGIATDTRDWNSDGPRRETFRRAETGYWARNGARTRRCSDWCCRSFGSDATDDHATVRSQNYRLDDLRNGGGRVARRRAVRMLHPGTARHAGRSARGVEVRVNPSPNGRGQGEGPLG